MPAALLMLQIPHPSPPSSLYSGWLETLPPHPTGLQDSISDVVTCLIASKDSAPAAHSNLSKNHSLCKSFNVDGETLLSVHPMVLRGLGKSLYKT